LGMLQIHPSEALFVDDRQYNVDASNALGIRAILYTNFEKFKTDLEAAV
jgi:FMN phosphatase YigB (HAD superfamily)